MAFEGASDDLIEIEGDVTYDEVNHLSSKPWTAVVYDPDSGGAMQVMVHYGLWTGAWFIGVAPYDEDAFFPPWPIRISASRDTPYSARLEIDVPYHAFLTKVSSDSND